MNKQLLQFENQNFGKLTVIEKDGEFFFIGNEVAEKLGYSNYRKAVMVHVDDADKLRSQIGHAGQKRDITLINESGLYSLILSSKLPQAKEFKHWVTREVLPSIRKNGGYLRNQEKMSKEEILASAVLVAQNLIEEKDKEIKELKPKAKYYDELVDTKLLTNFRNTAKELHIPQNMFIKFLIDKKLIYRDMKNRLLPYANKNKGYFEIKEWYGKDGIVYGIQTLVTPKGRQYLLLLVGGDVNCD